MTGLPARLLLIALFVMSYGAPTVSHAQDQLSGAKVSAKDEKVKSEILALLNNMDKEAMAGNKEPGVIRSSDGISLLFKYYTKDYICIMPDGSKKTVADLRSGMEMIFQMGCQSLKPTTEITDIIVKGDTASVLANFKSEMEMRRKDGIINVLENSGTGRDFWVKIDGKWFLKRSRIITQQNTVDGKPLP